MMRIVGDALTFIWNICDVFPNFHNRYGERGAVAAVLTAVVLNCCAWSAALEISGKDGLHVLWCIPAVMTVFALEFALIRILFGSGGSCRHDWIAASALLLAFSMAALLCTALGRYIKGTFFAGLCIVIWSIPAANAAVGLQLVFRVFGLKPREAVWAAVPFLAEGGIAMVFLLREFGDEIIC